MAFDYRGLPSVDLILSTQEMEVVKRVCSHTVLVNMTREVLDEIRDRVAHLNGMPTAKIVGEMVADRVDQLLNPGPQSVLNATGVIIHTNLGRAPLSRDAITAIQQTAANYSDLEFSVEDGGRGIRHRHLQPLLRQVTGAKDGIAVNNNASALVLALTALAKGKEIIISRGEAVEIGGGFRIPDILLQSGVILKEVGTTNRTYLKDYEAAITDQTAAILRVHSSNFRIIGFTHSPSTQELAKLSRDNGLLMIDDLGSGCLLDTTPYGLVREPTPKEGIESGVDIVLFSGDKLLGGPQAGIAVGNAKPIQSMASHPLARAFRLDKIGLAALSATLIHYVRGDAVEKIPVWRMISSDIHEIEQRALAWQNILGGITSVIPGFSTIGGGSLPGETIPTWLLAINWEDENRGKAPALARKLRLGDPGVIARITRDQVVLDPRTVLPEDDEKLITALSTSLGINR